MVIKKDIYDKNSILILAKGTEVTDIVVERLKRLRLYNPDDIIDSEEIETEEIKTKETTKKGEQTTLSITQNFRKKINIRNFQYLELPNKILGTIIFESKNKPWWIYVNALSNYLDWIYTHSINVSLISTMMAVELKYNDKELWNISLGAFFHDLGMLVVPKSIISKSEPLNDMEMSNLKQHCELGISSLKPFTLPKECTDIVIEHHERLDGSGYPKGLKGDEISRNAKIVMIADVIDEVTTERPYRGTLGMDDAFMIVRENKRKFSQELIDLLEKIINSM